MCGVTVFWIRALELIDFKQLLQGILFNESDSTHKTVTKQAKYIAIGLFILLAILAILQGGLALYRYEELSSTDSSSAIEKYSWFILAFYFLLGFLTPIVAAIAFVSLDIFFAIIFSFIEILIRFLQKIISGVFYAVETIILITSSPIDKILEFFGLFQPQNINQVNKTVARPVIRWAPLQNNSPIYKENRSDIYDNYSYGIRRKNKLLFVCENPKIHLAYPSEVLPVKKDMKIDEISQYIINQNPIFEGKDIKYYYINNQGVLEQITKIQNLNDLVKLVDYVNIEIDENSNAYQQQI